MPNLGYKIPVTACAALAALSASPAQAGSKSQSWNDLLGTWCMLPGDGDNLGVYFGVQRKECLFDEHENKIIIGEDGYEMVDGETATCRYVSGKARFDKTIDATTKTTGVYVFHIVSRCTRSGERVGGSWRTEFDIYISKGTMRIENIIRPR
jgi:hypothetical protein